MLIASLSFTGIAVLVSMMLILYGCGSDEQADTVKGNWYLTPQGYVLKIPDSVYQNGLYLWDSTVTDPLMIQLIIKEWFDSEIEEWIQVHDYRNSLKSANYTIHNHWFFKVDGDMCAGYIIGNNIDVALYHKYEGIPMPTMNYALHTLIWHEDDQERGVWKWYAGYIPQNGRGMPALKHELGHLYYGGNYGH